MSAFSVTLVKTKEETVLLCKGRFDFSSYGEFNKAILSSISEVGSSVVVNLSGVDYMDSSALGMLLVAKDKVGAAKVIKITNAKGTVKSVLEIASFHKLFNII